MFLSEMWVPRVLRISSPLMRKSNCLLFSASSPTADSVEEWYSTRKHDHGNPCFSHKEGRIWSHCDKSDVDWLCILFVFAGGACTEYVITCYWYSPSSNWLMSVLSSCLATVPGIENGVSGTAYLMDRLVGRLIDWLIELANTINLFYTVQEYV